MTSLQEYPPVTSQYAPLLSSTFADFSDKKVPSSTRRVESDTRHCGGAENYAMRFPLMPIFSCKCALKSFGQGSQPARALMKAYILSGRCLFTCRPSYAHPWWSKRLVATKLETPLPRSVSQFHHTCCPASHGSECTRHQS